MSSPGPMLQIRSLCRRFGGVRAVDDLSITLPTGGIHSIIGPNGSGKTTLLNLISGAYVPTSGSICLFGADVTGRRADQLAALGLARTFQNLQVCTNLNALDNVLVGAHLRARSGLLEALTGWPAMRRHDAELAQEAHGLLKLAGIEGHAARPASAMPYGALKKLEIARALAGRPRVLLLDEPAAGLNPSEKAELGRLLERIASSGVTVVLVEHDMRMVMALSDHVLVLERGTLLAEGKAQQIKDDPRVVAAYLGEPAVEAA